MNKFLNLRLGSLMILMSMQCYLPLQAQDKGDERVTLMAGDVTLASVLKNIEKQTHKRFNYSENELNTREKIHVSYSDAPLHQVLGQLFTAKGISWKVIDNGIYLRKEDMPVKQPAPADSAVNVSVIRGTITDESGMPLPGATVMIKGTNVGTSADGNGRFVLGNSSAAPVLRVSFTSYETREVIVRNERSLNITLKRVIGSLDETVVIGYGTTTKRFNTGAVSTVKSNVIEAQPVTNPLQALEGRVPGLYIAQTTGIPGSGSIVTLRGKNSISSGNDPFYIVDGVPFTSSSTSVPNLGTGSLGSVYVPGGGLSPFNLLNPSDIERIDVLKDADATAIYGSRGANGVILITTKKGKAGKTKFDINASYGQGKVTNMLSLLNTPQYLAMRREALKNDNKTAGPTDYDINGTWDTTRYTNWQKELIGGTASLTNIQAGISGGSIGTQFNIRGTYTRQGTVFPGDFSDNKSSALINIVHTSPNGKLHATINVNFLNNINNVPNFDFTSYILTAPDGPALHDSKGNLNWESNTFYNPLGLTKRFTKSTSDNLNGNFTFGYEILPGLTASASLGYNQITTSQTQQTSITSVSPTFASYSYIRSNNYGSNSLKSWIAEPQLNYSRKIGKNGINVLFGSSFQQSTTSSNAYLASDFVTDALIANPASAAKLQVLSALGTQYRYNALFGRITYDFDRKYILNFTARRDGSSRFGPGKQFGNFGAIGAAWLFSEENWVKQNIPLLSFGKLRASYGTTGNDQIADYQYYSTYSSSYTNYMGLSGLVPNRIPNADFRWEQVRKLEMGLETGFCQDKILINIDYYRNRSSNQLLQYTLPTTTGFNSVLYNLPALVQNTGIELEINTANIANADFSWRSSLNLTIPRNKLINYPNFESSAYSTKYVIGKSILGQRAFHYTGVDPLTGYYTVQDVNNDGQYTSADYTSFIQLTQDYYGGLLNTFNYKGIELGIFLQFVKQAAPDYISQISPVPGSKNNNIPTFILENTWHNKGDKTQYQKFSTGNAIINTAAYYYRAQSDANQIDGSFIRLKNVMISYVLPQRLLQELHLQNIRLYAQAQNLLTFTSYKWLDPESNSGLSLPPLKMINLGIQLSL